MNRRFRAVAIVALLLASGWVCAEVASYPSPDQRDAYRVTWSGGAKVLRVREVGPHLVLLTLDTTRVVDARNVTERVRTREGNAYTDEYGVFLLGDAVGLADAQRSGKPSPEWWDRVLKIDRSVPDQHLDPLGLPDPKNDGKP